MLQTKKKSDNFIITLKMAFPIIIQGLVFQLQAVVDKAFLGRIDTKYLSAIGVAQLPFFTSVDSLTAICTGLTIIVAMKFGAGKIHEIHKSVNASIAYNMLISLLLFVIWFTFSDTVFSWMNVDDSLIQSCNDYVRLLSFFLILYGIDISLQAALQGMGKTKPIMYAGLIKVFLNILLAWILIFGKLGSPALYVKGAAIATATANIVGTLILAAYFAVSKELSANIKLREIIRFRWSLYKGIIRLGLPTGTEFLLWNISNLFLISLLNKQGVEAVAIFTVTFAIEIFVYMIFNGIARSTLTLVGNSIGAGNEKAAKSILTNSIGYSILFVFIFCIIFAVFPKPLLSIFTTDKDLISKSVFYLIIRGIIMFPQSVNVVVGSGNRAKGDVMWMLYTQIFGSIFVVTFSYILVDGFQIGAFAIYLTLFLDELLRAALNTVRFYKRNIFRAQAVFSSKSKKHSPRDLPCPSETACPVKERSVDVSVDP